MSWSFQSQWLVPDKLQRFSLLSNSKALTVGQVFELWGNDAAFGLFFTQTLAATSFAAFRWETPATSASVLDQPYEFVLIAAPELNQRRTDRLAFGEHFRAASAQQSIISFDNLGGDATLVVPLPQTTDKAYNHLAVFLREAPAAQKAELWRTVSSVLTRKVSSQPLWLSTAGGGVAWLHVRIDSHPKYYHYQPYQLLR